MLLVDGTIRPLPRFLAWRARMANGNIIEWRHGIGWYGESRSEQPRHQHEHREEQT